MAQHLDKHQTIRGHLEELRRRLFIIALCGVVAIAIAFSFHRKLLTLLMEQARVIPSISDTPLVFINVTEMLGVSMKVSLLGGFVLVLPVIAYEMLMFASPGLSQRERRYLYVSLPGITAAFVIGVIFGYFILLPPALRFLLTFNADIAAPMIRIGNYINLVVSLLFWMGVIFETPVIMFVLARLRVVTSKTFARWRRFAFIFAFILGAIITPTFDPINQSLVALPIILLYEIGIWLAWLAQRTTRRDKQK